MPSEKLTVLAVDDELEILELYRKILGSDVSGDLDILGSREDCSPHAPLECRAYTDPAKLLEDYRREVQQGRHYPLCIVDMKMSTPDEGLVTAVKLREIDKDIDIVFCTAVSHIAPEDVRTRLGERVFFVGKPFNNEEFVLMVQSLVDYWQSRQDLNRETAFLNMLLESVSELIFMKDAAGIYRKCNSMFARFANRRKEQIIGKTDYAFLPEDLSDIYRDEDREVMVSGKTGTFRREVKRPDGSTCMLETVKSPVRSTQGECIGLIGVARDISARGRDDSAVIF